MKRSQMLSEIESILRDTFALSYSEIAKAILDKAEALGMKPPVEETDPVLHLSKNVWEKENA